MRYFILSVSANHCCTHRKIIRSELCMSGHYNRIGIVLCNISGEVMIAISNRIQVPVKNSFKPPAIMRCGGVRESCTELNYEWKRASKRTDVSITSVLCKTNG